MSVPARAPSDTNVAACQCGTGGVRMTSFDLGGFFTAQRLVRSLNGAHVVDAAAEHAMQVGYLRGWHCEAADPDFLRAKSRGLMNAARYLRGSGVFH